jgi:hypothetical protein
VPLQILAQGHPLSPRSKLALSQGVKVIAAYREDSTRARDIYAMHANPDRTPRNEPQEMACHTHHVYGRPTEADQRAAADDMEVSVVEIGNLKSIERLLRILVRHPDINVKLIDPGRRGRD